jgi:hypothetical protein
MPQTEAEWLACDDPFPMLEVMRTRASDRKVRLFAMGSVKKRAAAPPESTCSTRIGRSNVRSPYTNRSTNVLRSFQFSRFLGAV